MNQTVIIFLFIPLLAISSVFVHEGVHWIQCSVDDRVETVGLVFSNNEQHSGIDYMIGVRWEAKNNEDFVSFKSESIHREIEAYGIQIIYMVMIVGWIIWRNKRKSEISVNNQGVLK